MTLGVVQEAEVLGRRLADGADKTERLGKLSADSVAVVPERSTDRRTVRPTRRERSI